MSDYHLVYRQVFWGRLLRVAHLLRGRQNCKQQNRNQNGQTWNRMCTEYFPIKAALQSSNIAIPGARLLFDNRRDFRSSECGDCAVQILELFAPRDASLVRLANVRFATNSTCKRLGRLQFLPFVQKSHLITDCQTAAKNNLFSACRSTNNYAAQLPMVIVDIGTNGSRGNSRQPTMYVYPFDGFSSRVVILLIYEAKLRLPP